MAEQGAAEAGSCWRGAGAGLPWVLPGLTAAEKVGCH